MNRKKDFWGYILDIAQKTDSLFVMNNTDRANLFDFFDINEWFGTGLNPDQKDFINGRIRIEADDMIVRCIEERLRLWMSAYKRSNGEKYSLLLGYARDLWPVTADAYDRMIRSRKSSDKAEAWQLLDFFLCELTKELDQYRADEIENLVAKAAGVLTTEQENLFSVFWSRIKGNNDNAIAFRFQPHGKSREPKEAYTKGAFSKMAYLVFNPSSWQENHLVEKACSNGRHANLWAFISLHFVCGLRDTDIIKLPKPSLPYGGEVFREKVIAGEISEFGRYARELSYRLTACPFLPYKTRGYPNIPEVKVFIPDALEAPMGMILSIAASYKDNIKAGDGFIQADRDLVRIEAFFGRDFSVLLGGKNFVSQSANKAYLQGLAMAGEQDGSSRANGYLIAALARSHKGGIASIPEATEAYLKNAKFNGLEAEEAAWEITQRGVFGFIPHVLLEICYGKDYSRLSIPAQTKVIKELGLKPTVIETIVRLKEKGIAESRKAVSEMVCGKDVKEVINRIAGGQAGARNPSSACLMTASGHACRFPENSGCIGCKYEIHTKTGLHLLMKEYARMYRLLQDENGWKYRALIRETVLPILAEYVSTLREHPGADEESIRMIIERGMEGYAHISSSGL